MTLALSGDDWQLVDFDAGQHESIHAFVTGQPSDHAIQATVPGDVHADLERAGRLPDLWFGTNSQQAHWVPQKTWCYRKQFSFKGTWRDRRIWLLLEGVDYAAQVWLNGQKIGRHEGPFTPARFEITGIVYPEALNTLAVVIERAPQEILNKLFLPRTQENRQLAMDEVTRELKCWKSRTMTGWDWGTPIWAMGVWRGVQVLGTQGVLLDNALVRPRLKAPYNEAALQVTTRLDADRVREVELQYIVECTTAEAPGVTSRHSVQLIPGEQEVQQALHLDRPQLWWPNGYGSQNRYALHVTVLDAASGQPLDTITTSFGVRDLQIAENTAAGIPRSYQDHWTNEPNDVWQERGAGTGVKDIAPDYQSRCLMVINGRPIFARGANWLPADLLFGRAEREQLEHLIRLAAMGNHNVFRVWGGGLIESSLFYELCDRYGIMVWQEMPHAGRRPLETDAALEFTAFEQRTVMRRIMNHPSLMRYGFGNELYLHREDSRQVAQFEDICAQIDPSRPAQAASPVTKDQRHGPHWFKFETEYAVYNSGYTLAAGADNPAEWSEYGASGASSVDTLKRIMPQASLWPPDELDENWRWHNGFGAYMGEDWLMPQIYRPLFGTLPDLQTEVQVSQWAQAEGLRYANQSHRRAKWHRSGCYSWTFNEPWPNAAHGCVVEYFGKPKMAYYYARSSYASIDVSAQYDQLAHPVSKPLNVRIYITSDRPDPIDHCSLTATLIGLDGQRYGQKQWQTTIESDQTITLGELGIELPAQATGRVVLLHLKLADTHGGLLSEQTYTFSAYADEPGETPFQPLLSAPQAEVTALVKGCDVVSQHGRPSTTYQLAIENRSDVPALFVAINPTDSNQNAYVSNNYVTLLPSAGHEVEVLVPGECNGKHELTISAWNAPLVTAQLNV